ncbi:MAG: hypothetical protein KC418_01385 [Anaerolineales bacterium]|nr:hypothetical protein [Anaerolineales bacterium]MCB8951112.1 hypothetical protein [Ardenticatenales bacterium]
MWFIDLSWLFTDFHNKQRALYPMWLLFEKWLGTLGGTDIRHMSVADVQFFAYQAPRSEGNATVTQCAFYHKRSARQMGKQKREPARMGVSALVHAN